MSYDQHNMKITFGSNLLESRTEKANSFWKFIESQTVLQPYRVSTGSSKLATHTTCGSTTTTESESDKNFTWKMGLDIFEKTGMDKVAFASAKKCKVCSAPVSLKSLNKLQQKIPTQEELNNEILMYEQHREN